MDPSMVPATKEDVIRLQAEVNRLESKLDTLISLLMPSTVAPTVPTTSTPFVKVNPSKEEGKTLPGHDEMIRAVRVHEAATARLKNRSDESSQRLRGEPALSRTFRSWIHWDNIKASLPTCFPISPFPGKIVMAHMESVTETATAIYEAMAISNVEDSYAFSTERDTGVAVIEGKTRKDAMRLIGRGLYNGSMRIGSFTWPRFCEHRQMISLMQ